MKYQCPKCNKDLELLVGSLVNDGKSPRLYSLYCDACWNNQFKFVYRTAELAIQNFQRQVELLKEAA